MLVYPSSLAQTLGAVPGLQPDTIVEEAVWIHQSVVEGPCDANDCKRWFIWLSGFIAEPVVRMGVLETLVFFGNYESSKAHLAVCDELRRATLVSADRE